MTDLFRKEVVARSRRRLDGEVLLAVPLPTRIFGWLALAVVCLSLIFAATASYARKETVAGWLTPGGGLIRVHARQGGVVTGLRSTGAEFLDPGTVLLTARSSVDTGKGSAAELIGADITAEAQADDRNVAAQLERLSAETERVHASITIGERELSELEKRIGLQETQLELARQVVERSRSLADRGYLPRRELDARVSAALSAEENLSQSRTQKLVLERQANESRARLRELPVERAALFAQAAAARAQLAQRATDVSVQGQFAIVAPVGGKLEELTVRQGQSFSSGDTVAVLSPAQASLEVELFIPARAIGFVATGQEVKLLLDAFPFEKFGAIDGEIISVSATSLAPTELGNALVSVREPVYRTRVRLMRTSISAYGAEVPLRSGMTVTADIIIDRRSLLEWLLDPLYATGRRG